MKLRHLLMAVIAGAFAFTACEDEIDLGAAKVSFVEPAELVLNFGPEESSSTVTFVCTRDWNISEVMSGTLPDWIALSATSGEASNKEQSVTVTVMENPGNDRETTITFTIGLAKAALTVKQEGKLGGINPGTGTKDDPYSVKAALEYIATLGADVQSSNSIYVKGIISDVATTFEASGSYGNASFYMVDTEGSEDRFYAFQTYYLGNRKWKSGDTDVKAGDQVIICGPVVNYKGNTPETVGKGASYIYSLNGKTEGGAGGDDTDYSKVPAKTVKEFIEAADVNNYYKLTGKVSRFNASYCSFDLTDETGTIYVYSVDNKADWSSKIANDGVVTLAGKYAYYSAKEQHEVVNAQILSFEGNGNTGGEETFAEPAGQGTEESPFNVSRAIEKAKSIGETASEQVYYVKGKVSAVKEQYGATYGNGTFELVDEGYTAVFTAYRILYLGNKKWQEGDATVSEGDVIVAAGKFVNYKGNTPEITANSGWLVSLNGQTTIEQGPVFGVESASINVAASATSATIKVTGNVDWVAESRECELMGSSGTGAGEVTAVFAINNTDAPIVYNVVIKTQADVERKEITVTITQAKPSSGSGDHFEVQWLEAALAAAKDKGEVNQMDDVISFTNSSSYSGEVGQLRIYKGQTLTITAAAGYTIEDIGIICTASGTDKYGPGCFTVTPDTYNYSDTQGIWQGEAQQVVFKAETNQVRIVELKVHYHN